MQLLEGDNKRQQTAKVSGCNSSQTLHKACLLLVLLAQSGSGCWRRVEGKSSSVGASAAVLSYQLRRGFKAAALGSQNQRKHRKHFTAASCLCCSAAFKQLDEWGTFLSRHKLSIQMAKLEKPRCQEGLQKKRGGVLNGCVRTTMQEIGFCEEHQTRHTKSPSVHFSKPSRSQNSLTISSISPTSHLFCCFFTFLLLVRGENAAMLQTQIKMRVKNG